MKWTMKKRIIQTTIASISSQSIATLTVNTNIMDSIEVLNNMNLRLKLKATSKTWNQITSS